MLPKTKIQALQALLVQEGIDAWIVPSTDPHQSEYVAPHWQARAWLSGFAGSAGTLVVTPAAAGLWTDARYHLRAETELAGSGITLFRQGLPDVPDLFSWLQNTLDGDVVIGFDGNLLSMTAVERLARTLAGREVRYFTARDLVAELWTDRPPGPTFPIECYDAALAGASRLEKLNRIRMEMAAGGADAHLLTALDDIAWTLNIRGRDVAHNPVTVAYALILPNEVTLFIEPAKVSPAVRAALAEDGVICCPYDEIERYWADLPPSTAVLIDPAQTGYHLGESIAEHCALVRGASIPRRLKAIKNATEQVGARSAHIRDGVAMVRWLIWLEQAIGREPHTEVTVAAKLDEFRSRGERFRDLSFNTIVGYGPNSAIGHYQPRAETSPALRAQGILLVDSGAHYLDGTTDITRTVTLGAPTTEERQVYTAVLQSLIRLATARFPRGTRGDQLDALARDRLWREGWECRHGIGHGVGHYLNVHEGPPRFSQQGGIPLAPGMVLSNEPGVYFAGSFGVRLENLMIVTPWRATDFGSFDTFETITLCPFDRKLIERASLSADETAWLNDYHARVFATLGPVLTGEERAWLAAATRPLT